MRDQLGFLGTLFVSLCCLGVSVVIAPLTAIGLGFLINDLILIPLVLVFLLITLWGLHSGRKRHREGRPSAGSQRRGTDQSIHDGHGRRFAFEKYQRDDLWLSDLRLRYGLYDLKQT